MIIRASSDAGKVRTLNEDYYFISESPVGVFDALMVLSDGMGGYEAGEVASRLSVEEAVRVISDSPMNMPLFILEQAVNAANLAVRRYSASHLNIEMGATLVVCGIINGWAYVMNVGDSRLYLLNSISFNIRQITKDHSYVEEMVERGLMKRNSPEYAEHQHAITRAVGFFPEIQADAFEFPLEEGDYLLLCSDGLSNMLKNIVIKNLALDTSFSLEKRVQTMIEEANRQGGKDNITVILADTEET